ncbi:biopolymer transporter ExbD [bacterium]|nr:biopolymer transporter ExbD [bacterium]
MAYRPSRKRKVVTIEPELNITPIMNLMVVLIPMLLAVAQFVQVSLLEYQPPPSEVAADSGTSEEKRLDLVVNVLPRGYEVSLFGATSGKDYRFIGKKGGDYNIQELQDHLKRLHQNRVGVAIDTVSEVDPVTGTSYRRPIWEYVDAEVVSIAARGGTPFQEVVRVIDAARSWMDEEGVVHPLFPIPRLGQIQ